MDILAFFPFWVATPLYPKLHYSQNSAEQSVMLRVSKVQKIILAIVFMLSSSGAVACSCVVSDPSLKASIRSHEALVWVKTLSREKVTTERGEYYKTKVSIIKFWKGDSTFGEYYVMTETEESSSCGGPPLILEDELLVYAWAQDGKLLYTGGCSSYSSINLESTKKEVKKINKYFKKSKGA